MTHTNTRAHTHELKLKDQSVQKIEWKQTDRRTYRHRQADTTDWFTP